MYRLLLIDDDRDVLVINKSFFSHKGYDVKVAVSAERGIAALETFAPDCILLDVMMPRMNGFEACGRIRERSNSPILFLTGKLDEQSKVRGLMLGGDDYIAKPYGMAELEARIIANIRRSRMASADVPDHLNFPPLEIHIASHQAFCRGENLMLTNREYDLMYMLCTHTNEIVTFEQIAIQLWGQYRVEDRSAVMMNMSRLRKKLEGVPAAANLIETEWGRGYRFIGERKSL